MNVKEFLKDPNQPIVIHPSGVLREVMPAVTEFDGDLRSFCQLMIRRMKKENAVGLAANQLNVLARVQVVEYRSFASDKLICMINPIIVEASVICDSVIEGCLSLPGIPVEVVRPREALVQWQDEYGRHMGWWFYGWNARVVQHELDHLNGILITDKRKVSARDNPNDQREV